MIKLIQDPEWPVRFDAARSLRRLLEAADVMDFPNGASAVDPRESVLEAVLPRLEDLLRTADPRVKCDVALVLGCVRTPEVVSLLIDCLFDQYNRLRQVAATALSELRMASAACALLLHLDDPDPRVRNEASDALRYVSSEEALPVLLERLKSRDSEMEKAEFIRAIGRCDRARRQQHKPAPPF